MKIGPATPQRLHMRCTSLHSYFRNGAFATDLDDLPEKSPT